MTFSGATGPRWGTSSQSEPKEKFVDGVDKQDKSEDSMLVVRGEDDAEELVEAWKGLDGCEMRSLSREVEAEV